MQIFFLCMSELYLLSRDAPFTAGFYHCFQVVPAQLREQHLELVPPEAAAKCLAEISLTAPHLNHSCSRDCRCGPEHVTAVLPQAPWCLGAGEPWLVKPSLQPCMILWEDGGFSLVLSKGIQQHLQCCGTQSQHTSVQAGEKVPTCPCLCSSFGLLCSGRGLVTL